MIWGTTISLKATMDSFADFVSSFVLLPTDADGAAVVQQQSALDAENEPYYRRLLLDLARSEKGQTVNIDMQHIRSFGENGRLL